MIQPLHTLITHHGSCLCGILRQRSEACGLYVRLETLRVRNEIKVADRAEILSILQGAKSEHIEYM